MNPAADSAHFSLDETAANYRRYLEPYLFAPWAEKLIAAVGVEPGVTVLDVAAGTGAVSRAAASAVGASGRVIASDISAAMLHEVSNRTMEGADADAAPITTLESSASNLDLPSESVDIVLCQQGLQFMPDKPAVIDELFRVLRPGALVGIAVWSRGPWIPPLDDYEQFVSIHPVGGSIVNDLPREQFRMLPSEIANLLDLAGFVDVASADEQLTVSWPSALDEARGILGSPFGRRILLQPVVEQEELIAELTKTSGGEHVMTSVIATARKP
jgi:ubiquinone/menaquinone biosynthesis C-methylase UbiE